MPSCVVKSCRNHSGSIKKSQGITIHRFPSANDVWKNDWIKIIRECRNENDWNPSKSSVICSIHFEKNCLYTTKGGLLRVVAYAIPTKFLFDPSTIQDQPTEVITSSVSDESSLVIEPVASGSGQQKKIEQPFSQNVTTLLTQSSSMDEGISVQESTVQQSCLLNTNSSLKNRMEMEFEHAFAGIEHKIALIKYIAEKYLNIRFHHICKLEGISRCVDSKRQIYKNLNQQKGL